MTKPTPLKSTTLTLGEIFNEGFRSFEIPDYQRSYSWEKSHRTDLLNDIENTSMLSNYKHFAGTIVVKEKGNVDGVTSFEVVDGQQRMTSLVMLLSVLAQRKFLPQDQIAYINTTFLFRGKDSGNTIRLFKLNGNLDNYFYRKLEQWDYTSEEHATKAQANIDNAFSEFNNWLEDGVAKDPSFTKTIYSTITEKIVFLFHVPDSPAEVGLMFEVINNRGKKLSELEKIKNYLIYYAEKAGYRDIATAVADNWGKILYNLNACNQTSNEQEDSFLRFTWIVFERANKAESYYVYNNIKRDYPGLPDSNWRRLKAYVEFIAECAQTYNKLLTQNLVVDPREQKILKQISFQGSRASITPLILAVYSKVKESEQRIELLAILEKLNFRFYGCGVASRADVKNGHLFGTANEFFNNYNINDHATEWLKQDLLDFVERECNDERFIQALVVSSENPRNYFYWNNLKYFLANYEENIAASVHEKEDFTRFLLEQDPETKNANFEKEHIIATNECTALVEAEDLHKWRLGNFVLLRPTINKSIQDAPLYQKLIAYTEKIDQYLTPRSVAELSKLYGVENIAKEQSIYTREFLIRFLDQREEKLINFALRRWGLGKGRKILVNSISDQTPAYRFEGYQD
ncbi:DUF262 domain-containing protein [Chryseolinea soli]|nr:DUF262 domain-containing protein [Chryseolinea soli]